MRKWKIDETWPDDIQVVRFADWVRNKIDSSGETLAALSRESGIMYPALARLLHRDSNLQPRLKTAVVIVRAMVRLGIIDDEGEGLAAAGYWPHGYRLVRERRLHASDEERLARILGAGYLDLPERDQIEIVRIVQIKRDLSSEVAA